MKKKPEKRPLHVDIPVSLHEAIEIVAYEAGLSKTAWVIFALRSKIRNWDSSFQNNKRKQLPKKPPQMELWDSGWLKGEACWTCGKLHDPLEHASVNEEDIELMKGGGENDRD